MSAHTNQNNIHTLNDNDFFSHPDVIEGLLGRSVHWSDLSDAARHFDGKSVLITGAAGSIGQGLAKKLVPLKPSHLILTDVNTAELMQLRVTLESINSHVIYETQDMDICNAEAVDEVFRRCRPEIVLHTAANKYIEIAEAAMASAIKINIHGSITIAEAANKYGAKQCILMSTDKACNPVSVLGATKRIAEIYFQAMDMLNDGASFSAVRTGNVMGSNGSALRLFRQQIKDKLPLTITSSEMKRYFVPLPDITSAVLLTCCEMASRLERDQHITMPHMDRQHSIIDIVERLCGLSGLVLGRDIEIQVMGLRSGEKMDEELIGSDESFVTSSRNELLKIRPSAINDPRQVCEDIAELCLAAHENPKNVALLKASMALIAPTYCRSARGCVPVSQRTVAL